VTVVNTNIGGGRRGEDLTLIFKRVISLSNGDREITGGVRFQVGMPEEKVRGTTATEAEIERA